MILAHFDKGLPFGIGPPIGEGLDLLGGEGEWDDKGFDLVVEFLALLLGHLRLLLIEPIAQGAEDGGCVDLVAGVVDASTDDDIPAR